METYTVGGQISGLAGSGLVLRNNRGNDLPVASGTSFAFDTPLGDCGGYNVTVKTQPGSQICSVSAGSGILAGNNIDNVMVTCVNSYVLTYTHGADGSLTGILQQTVVQAGNGTAVTAQPATGYHFFNWSDGSTDNPRIDTNVTADIDVTANFAIDIFTLDYDADPNGTLDGDPAQTVNYNESGEPVTANAAPNYHFVNWSDGSIDNPRTDSNVIANVNVTANFEIDNFTVTSSVDGADGNITPLGDQQVNWNETTEFTLAPESAYMIDSVTGTCGGSLNELTYTTNPITGPCTVVASFKLKPNLMFENGFEAPPKLVFITSAAYSGNLGGLDGADLKCNTLATAAGLPGTYAAWLSTTSPSPAINAKDRIGDNTWVRTDGAVVADNLADLIDSTIQNTISLDEHGTPATASLVWTGTGGSGTFSGNLDPCSGWTRGSDPATGLRGTPSATDRNWTQSGALGRCGQTAALYCFGL